MYGWRARIGSISTVPSDVFPYEFYQIVPEGVTLMQTNLAISKINRQHLAQAWKAANKVASVLALEGVDLILMGGAPMVYYKKSGSDRVLSDRITELTGIQTICNITAMMDALKALGCEKILLASPHGLEANEKLKTFLEGSGFQVVGTGGMNLIVQSEINRRTRQQTYQFVKDTFRDRGGEKAEAILMPCDNWPSSVLVSRWEEELGIPVVTSNMAKIWAALKALEINEHVRGFGRLLDHASGSVRNVLSF